MKHNIILFTCLYSLCIFSVVQPSVLDCTYTNNQFNGCKITSCIAVLVMWSNRLSEIAAERKVVDYRFRIKRLRKSLRTANRLKDEGKLPEDVDFNETEEQLAEYRELLQKAEDELKSSTNWAAGAGAIQGLAAVASNKVEKGLTAFAHGLLAAPIDKKLYGTRSQERKWWCFLEGVLLFARHALYKNGGNNANRYEGLDEEKLFWLTTAQRLTTILHTWRRHHGLRSMPVLVRGAFFFQLLSLVAGCFTTQEVKDPVTDCVLTEEDVCLICYHSATEDDVVKLQCCKNSYYHRTCIKRWTGEKSSCPTCRKAVSVEIDNIPALTSTPPFLDSSDEQYRDKRIKELRSPLANNILRYCLPLRIYAPHLFTGSQTFESALAALSVGTIGDPVAPTL